VTPDINAVFSPKPPIRSTCEDYRELIEQGLARGRNGKAIWQDLVSENGYGGSYQAVKRFIQKLRGSRHRGPAFVRFLQRFIISILVPLLMPFLKILSTPKRSARGITKIMTDASGQAGVYYDEGGRPMQGSALVHDPKF
jgi:hypothetical protein